MKTVTLSNGTVVRIGPGWACTVLPDGTEVHAHPNEESPAMALRLGYGDDVGAMTEDHDLLHSIVADWLGQPHSHSLALAAGLPADRNLAWLEEDAVLALQRLIAALGPARPRTA